MAPGPCNRRAVASELFGEGPRCVNLLAEPSAPTVCLHATRQGSSIGRARGSPAPLPDNGPIGRSLSLLTTWLWVRVPPPLLGEPEHQGYRLQNVQPLTHPLVRRTR